MTTLSDEDKTANGGDFERLMRRRLDEIASLPPIPRRSQELIMLLADPDLSMVQLIELIEQTPSLAGRVFGVANSAYFAAAQQVRSISDAVIRVMGLHLVRDLCMSLVLSQPFTTSASPSFLPLRFWRHAMFSAALVHELSRVVDDAGRGKLPNAYLAGLLHSLGMLALVHIAPVGMERVFAGLNEDQQAKLSYLQARILGIDYAQAGGELARAWKLPAPIVNVLSHHRNSGYRGSDWQLVALVGFADQMSKQHIDGEDSTACVDRHRSLLDELAIGEENLALAVTTWQARLQNIEQLAMTFQRRPS